MNLGEIMGQADLFQSCIGQLKDIDHANYFSWFIHHRKI